jgi:hypothetical protein
MSNNHRGVLYTYSGKVLFPGGAPSVLDMAVSHAREGRFAGAGQRFFPVALHLFCVADLLPPHLRFDGLLHDSPEVITGDTPKPAKTEEIEAFEEELLRANYAHYGVTFPDEETRRLVKIADRKVYRGEIYTVGNLALQEFDPPCVEAEDRIFHYVKEYTYEDMLETSGRVPMEFMHRFRLYKLHLDADRIIR